MTTETPFDKQLQLLDGLNYYPWIGEKFLESKVLIVGDSHYDDGDGWLQGNKYATRQMINNQGLSSEKPEFSKSRILRLTEELTVNRRLLEPIDRGKFWKKVSFMNLSQTLLPSIKIRPSEKDFDGGWLAFLEYVNIVKPKICIKLGIDGIGRLGYLLNNTPNGWKSIATQFHKRPLVITLSKDDVQLKMVVINHPTGSRGFDIKRWTEFIHLQFPELAGLVSDNNSEGHKEAA